MHVIVWKFEAAPGRRSQFEAAYGPNGTWARLFSRSKDYLGTELLAAPDGTHLTIDRWTSKDAYDAFRTTHAGEYSRIDRDCESFTEHEELVGAFDVLP